jgi:hypothetical protein
VAVSPSHAQEANVPTITATTTRRATRVLIASLATTVAATAAVCGIGAAPAHAAGSSLNVVAVGDSYASGEGAKGSGWIDSACHRSPLAAPQLAAAMLGQVWNTQFSSVACSGSVIQNGKDAAHELINGALFLGGAPGQLTRVTGAPIDALTVSIGGNDLDFGDIVQACMNPFTECEYDPSLRNNLNTALGNLGSGLDRLIAGVQGPSGVEINAPVRNVYVTEYPDPTTGLLGDRCGNSDAQPAGGFEGISLTEAEWLSQNFSAPLNAALAAAVNRANSAAGSHPVWHFVTGISQAFVGHGYCAPDTYRWINTPSDSLGSQGDLNGTMHPNAQGQQAIANVLYQYLVLHPSVTTPTTPVVNSPVDLTVRAVTADGKPVPGAQISLDGSSVGVAGANGTVLVPGHVFTTAGVHTILVQSQSFPDAHTEVAVQGLAYQVTSSPAPIPVGSSVPQLTLTARDTATNQLINGTFTISAPNGAVVNLTSGTPSPTAVVVRMGYTTSTELGPTGKPMTIRTPACPTVTFQPTLPQFQTGTFPSLIACSG